MTNELTSECVGPGHPDKVADQISDAVLDECLRQDPESRVACETLIKNNTVILAGEITTQAKQLNYYKTVNDALVKIGYDNFCPNVVNLLTEQSREISKAADVGAGDQGLMWGYATDETPTLMPTSMYLARELVNMLVWNRENDGCDFLLPDCKTQATVRDNSVITRLVISTNHRPEMNDLAELRARLRLMIEEWPCEALHELNYFGLTQLDLNPSGLWFFGGPAADTGVCGRKIVVDAYGADCQVGGGALSGKDGTTKVDRSGAYAARYIAKNIVAHKLARKAKVQLAYVIGQPDPVSFCVTTGQGSTRDKELQKMVVNKMGLTPKDFAERFGLNKPIFFETANRGHFGIDPCVNSVGNRVYGWEATDLF